MTTTNAATLGARDAAAGLDLDVDLELIEEAEAPVEPWVVIAWGVGAAALLLFGC